MSELIPSPNRSLRLWQPSEALLAVNLNLRERRYSGFYYEDTLSFLQNDPSFTLVSGGYPYGEGVYGFSMYGISIGGDSVLFSTLTAVEDTPVFTEAEDITVYDTGDVYGFAGYAASYITTALGTSVSAPLFEELASGYLYGEGGIRSIMQYEGAGVLEDTTTLADDTPTFLQNVLTVNTYGTSRKRGFCVYIGE